MMGMTSVYYISGTDLVVGKAFRASYIWSLWGWFTTALGHFIYGNVSRHWDMDMRRINLEIPIIVILSPIELKAGVLFLNYLNIRTIQLFLMLGVYQNIVKLTELHPSPNSLSHQHAAETGKSSIN